MRRAQPNLLKKIKQLAAKYRFLFVVQYGSSIAGLTPRDYDVAFASDHIPKISPVEIAHQLQFHFDKPVDIVFLTTRTDPLLSHEILTKGKLLYERKKESYIKFKVFAWKRYLDTKKFRDLEDLFLKKEIKHVP